jgi:hypothetical protein
MMSTGSYHKASTDAHLYDNAYELEHKGRWPCHYYNSQGGCSRGKECKWQHVVDTTAGKDKPCEIKGCRRVAKPGYDICPECNRRGHDDTTDLTGLPIKPISRGSQGSWSAATDRRVTSDFSYSRIAGSSTSTDAAAPVPTRRTPAIVGVSRSSSTPAVPSRTLPEMKIDTPITGKWGDMEDEDGINNDANDQEMDVEPTRVAPAPAVAKKGIWLSAAAKARQQHQSTGGSTDRDGFQTVSRSNRGGGRGRR